MTSPSISLDKSQTLAPAALQETTQKGSLEGRSVVPCPSKRWLTDTQIKRIALVAFAIFATAAFAAIGGALVFGVLAGGVVLGCMAAATFGTIGAICGGAPMAALWPHADFQTPKGAEKIRNELKAKNLRHLHDVYNFSDLAKYGYISKESANATTKLYFSFPTFPTVYDQSGSFDYITMARLAILEGTFEAEARIEAEFDALRSQPGFLL